MENEDSGGGVIMANGKGKSKHSGVPAVVQRMLDMLSKSEYRFLVGMAAELDSHPMLLVAEKDGKWRGLRVDVDGYKSSDARRLLRLALDPYPCTVNEIMSSVEEFAGKYRGKTIWITNAI
jgi:hypothetical protein